MRTFVPIEGNHGYGMAVAASEGTVTLGIRDINGQGEILVIPSLEEYIKLLEYLAKAALLAWPKQETSNDLDSNR